MSNVKEVASNIFSIDNRLYSIPRAGAVYFLVEDRKALIDPGPSTSIPAVIEGLHSLGYEGDDIDYIIITHIHLDHSGGAGSIIRQMPNAGIVAHQRAVRHLIDPSKLVVSAGDAQGQVAVRRNGEVLPVEAGRIRPAADGDTIALSDGQVLTFMETPGHATHELCIRESRHNGVFVGDAVGHYVEGMDVMIPVTPPPSFDLELYIKSLNRLKEINPDAIYFAHSGVGHECLDLLRLAENKLIERDRVIASAASENRLDEATELLVRHICSEMGLLREKMNELYNDWAENDIPMSARQHVRHYLKKHLAEAL
ncbi:MAG: MBL fold metallo-hydrolase [Dehalococcoidales bacterium]|nr:MBL fold metallo-hydrolase [Dehalococcoidales bacterium]